MAEREDWKLSEMLQAYAFRLRGKDYHEAEADLSNIVTEICDEIVSKTLEEVEERTDGIIKE